MLSDEMWRNKIHLYWSLQSPDTNLELVFYKFRSSVLENMLIQQTVTLKKPVVTTEEFS